MQPEATVEGSPLGPITQTLLLAAWKSLFDPNNSSNLHWIIINGDQSLGLTPFDPVDFSGQSPQLPVSGVADSVKDSACARAVTPLPIGSGDPQLQLLGVHVTGIGAVESTTGMVSFSPDQPQVTVTVNLGQYQGQAIPLVIGPQTDSSNKPINNFNFCLDCCVPVQQGSRTCSGNTWQSTASGTFTATISQSTFTATFQVNVPDSGPIAVQVMQIGLALGQPGALKVVFQDTGLPLWAQQMAQIAINQGVASGAVLNSFNTFMNGPDVKQRIETVANNAINHILAASAEEELESLE